MEYNVRKDAYKFYEKQINHFINIGLQVTRRCNLRCVHCCEPEQMEEKSLVEVEKIIDRLSEGGLKKICITGGEPFLRDDLVAIVKYAHGKKMFVTLSTNGFLLDQEKLLSMKPYIDNIRFSLHGTESIHNQIVQSKNGFNKVIESIQVSIKAGIPVSVVASIFVRNFSTMLDIAQTCERHQVDKLYFFSLISRGRANPIYDKEYVAFTRIQRSFDKIRDIARKEAWKMYMNLIDWSLEGQCTLIFPDGRLVGVPSFRDKDHTKIVGNILTEKADVLWGRYPFKSNYINYYKNH